MTALVLTPDRSVKKHVATIHIANKLSFLERKMSNVLLWNAYEDLQKEKTHCIRIKDLADAIGFDSNDRNLLKDSLRNLIRTVLEWNVIDEKGNEQDWEACSMLEYTRVRGQNCYYSYSDEMRKKLYNPEMYERINLSIQRKFSSGYSLALYENCLRFRKLGHTPWFQLDVFRDLMGVNPSEYSDFRRLNARVIKWPVEQVNNSSDIHLKVEYKRKNRRVIAIRFKVSDNPQASLFKEGKGEAREDQLAEASSIHARLVQFGLTETQQKTVLASHDAAYLAEILDLVRRDVKLGKVENLPAYTLAAIKNDYRPKRTEYEAEIANAKKTEREAVEKKFKAKQAEETKRHQQEIATLDGKIERLSVADKKDFDARFHQQLKANPVYQKFIHLGMESQVILGLYRAFAKRELFTDSQAASITV